MSLMNKPQDRTSVRAGQRGFSLIEVTFAILVLSTALVGALAMMVMGMARNTATRTDTTATNVAQTILEDIASAPPRNNTLLTITDCTGAPLTITTALGGGNTGIGAPVVGAAPGFPGLNPGDIDFTAAAVPGYSANYLMCGPVSNFTYDVRWRVDPVAGQNWAKLITVAARQGLTTNGTALYYSPPVTLRTVIGQ